jgi:hypothetical protein
LWLRGQELRVRGGEKGFVWGLKVMGHGWFVSYYAKLGV